MALSNGKDGWKVQIDMLLTPRDMGTDTRTRRGSDSPYPFGQSWCIKPPMIH